MDLKRDCNGILVQVRDTFSAFNCMNVCVCFCVYLCEMTKVTC